jgi:GntR family transcriptional repressor for pyruvate dehydrogenase complex
MRKKNKVRTFEKIAYEIESLIRSGYLKVGDFLPGERSLAVKLGVSRTSVREALRYLQSENIVTTIPGEGTKIIADDISVISETFSEAVGLSQLISLDLMEARKVIEVKNACFAAERATKTDLKRIEEILNNLYKALRANDEEEQERLNIPFHYAIARATHNVILVKMFAYISKIMQENITRRKFAISKDPAYAEIIYNQHVSIYNAIRKGQCNEASQLMFHHFEEFIERCTPRKK